MSAKVIVRRLQTAASKDGDGLYDITFKRMTWMEARALLNKLYESTGLQGEYAVALDEALEKS